MNMTEGTGWMGGVVRIMLCVGSVKFKMCFRHINKWTLYVGSWINILELWGDQC